MSAQGGGDDHLDQIILGGQFRLAGGLFQILNLLARDGTTHAGTPIFPWFQRFSGNSRSFTLQHKVLCATKQPSLIPLRSAAFLHPGPLPMLPKNLRQALTGLPALCQGRADHLRDWLENPTGARLAACAVAIGLGGAAYGFTLGLWRAPLMGAAARLGAA